MARHRWGNADAAWRRLFLLAALLAIGGVSAANAWELQRVRHLGKPHGLLHSEGGKGSGVCPQTRATAQAPPEFYDKKNPLPASRENIAAGRMLYLIDAQPTACKICHGAEGNGLGIMAGGLSPMPRNFTCAATMSAIPDGQLFWIITHGSPGTAMPAFTGFIDTQVWQLIHYLRHLSGAPRE